MRELDILVHCLMRDAKLLRVGKTLSHGVPKVLLSNSKTPLKIVPTDSESRSIGKPIAHQSLHTMVVRAEAS